VIEVSIERKDLSAILKKGGVRALLEEFRRALRICIGAGFAANTVSMYPQEDLKESKEARVYSLEIEDFMVRNLKKS
jgi:hypothetical protein